MAAVPAAGAANFTLARPSLTLMLLIVTWAGAMTGVGAVRVTMMTTRRLAARTVCCLLSGPPMMTGRVEP